MQALAAEISGCPHDVYIIADLNGAGALPPNPISSLYRLLSMGWPPRNIALVIAVNPPTIGRLAARVFSHIYYPIHAVYTVAEAHHIIEDYERGQPGEPPL